jgi:hypothetical protein
MEPSAACRNCALQNRASLKTEDVLMKMLIAAAAIAATVIGLQDAADAQQRAPVYRYCLMEHSGGGPGTAGGTLVCRFHTYEQCMASKTGWTDSCMINPQIAMRRR